jgi:hypothetical protein
MFCYIVSIAISDFVYNCFFVNWHHNPFPFLRERDNHALVSKGKLYFVGQTNSHLSHLFSECFRGAHSFFKINVHNVPSGALPNQQLKLMWLAQHVVPYFLISELDSSSYCFSNSVCTQLNCHPLYFLRKDQLNRIFAMVTFKHHHTFINHIAFQQRLTVWALNRINLDLLCPIKNFSFLFPFHCVLRSKKI